MFVKWLKPYIWCIDWFFFCLELYADFVNLNYCSKYDIGFFTRIDCFVWFWNAYYLISSSLIAPLLASICLFFLSIWIIVARMLLAVLREWCLCKITKRFFFSLIHFLLALICILVSFHLNYLSWYAIGSLTKRWFIFIIVKWLISYIQLIEWFFIYSNLYVVAFHCNYYREYVYGWF